MKAIATVPVGPSAPRLTTHVITEKLARLRFNDLLDAEHALGSRHPNGGSLYQVVCRGDEWIALLMRRRYHDSRSRKNPVEGSRGRKIGL